MLHVPPSFGPYMRRSDGPSMSAKRTTQRPAAKRNPPSPQEIAPGVFLGGWKDAARFEGARFCLLDEAPDDMPAGRHIPVYDEAADRPRVENLERLAREIRAAHDAGSPVLIFCGHGVRRSPLGAAWYLHRYEHLTLDEAYDRIRTVRPQVEHARDWIGNTRPLAG
jgi:Dual specificity phosphatase, catalytic domain